MKAINNSNNVAYKIILKTIINRLKSVLPSLITPFQNAFILRCLVSDNIILATEILHFIKRKTKGKGSLAIFNIDGSKAFDKINWDFLLSARLFRFQSILDQPY